MADVYLAVGHGRRPDGTFDPGASSGIHNEQRDAVPVTRAAWEILTHAGLDVFSEHEEKDDPNFWVTTERANNMGVRVLVSFHYDWSGAPPGAFMIATSDAGRRLGRAIETEVRNAGFEIRDYPDDRDDLYLLNNSNMPAVIFECGRIGHEAIDEVSEQERMGWAAGRGILDFLGVEEDMAEDPRIPDYLVRTLEDLHQARIEADGIDHPTTIRRLKALFLKGVGGNGVSRDEYDAHRHGEGRTGTPI